MPIRPKPVQLECPKCHWRGTFRPNSDALLGRPEDRPCPKCGHRDLHIVSRHPISASSKQRHI